MVDDAIVVVESVERNIEQGMDPKEAARRAMDQVGGAVVAIAIVLSAVFIPTAFISGITGEFYRQICSNDCRFRLDLGLQFSDPESRSGRPTASPASGGQRSFDSDN